MSFAVRVENLGKRYLISRQAERGKYRTLREAIGTAVAAPYRRLRYGASDPPEDFWALKDVSFDIQPGEVVGIIGRNGAGKSTLLKILSRITKPTTGRVSIRGRVASLLEVGTGFHQELTGRENIFLNGAILGMTRRDIRAKFDEIVAFAEVEKFLDTPVKRYSSGMYVRLAFAIAAHLEPEILIIDEVLAVGDAEFQKKCLGKMQDVAIGGRTVIFVSHNLNAVQSLCTTAMCLQGGILLTKGATFDCVHKYITSGQDTASPGTMDLTSNDIVRHGTGRATFTHISLLTDSRDPTGTFHFGQPFTVRLAIHSAVTTHDVFVGFSFISYDGIEIQGTTINDDGTVHSLAQDETIYECKVAPMLLTPGQYTVRAAIFTRHELFDHVDCLTSFEVCASVFQDAIFATRHHVGHVFYPYTWQTYISPSH